MAKRTRRTQSKATGDLSQARGRAHLPHKRRLCVMIGAFWAKRAPFHPTLGAFACSEPAAMLVELPLLPHDGHYQATRP